MEKQFILRFPDQLKGIDFSNAKLTKVSNKEISFTYNNVSYTGVISKLPTILESQKSIDGKLYKVADISTLITVYPNKDIDIDDEISRLEKSGVTPPMSNISELRKSILPPDNTEQRVAELLAEDARAIRVEIIGNEESTSDIDEFAAELEKALPTEDLTEIPSANANTQIQEELLSNKIADENEIEVVVNIHEDPELLEIESKINEKKKLLEKALNPILKKRFNQAIEELEKEYENMKNEKYNN